MPKRTKKLLVYLDQNFISEIAKRDLNSKVRPEFTDLYDILKKGFREEKLVVPQSHFHEVETSLAPVLKEQIVKYQNYVGQVGMQSHYHVEEFQIARSLQRFIGQEQDPLDIGIAFRRHPDQRVKQFNITVNTHYELQELRTGRERHAENLEALRCRIKDEGLSYAAQLKQEFHDAELDYSRRALRNYGHLATEQQLVAFGKSEAFRETPIVKISCQLYAKLLTERNRSIREGDSTDVQVISTFVPYVDVMATDHFMAITLKQLGIDQEYSVRVFGGKTQSVRDLIAYLQEYVATTDRVNRPSTTAFVLPTPDMKEHCFDFYRQLGMAEKWGFQNSEYVEVFGFDDGNMPEYEFPRMPGHRVSFSGLQDVDHIPLPEGSTVDEILEICREHCNSTHFVLIDKFQDVPNHFFHGVIMSSDAKGDTAYGYNIYRKES